jgi:EAL domain-containing protein (putative c-di-GMP-specific phosphodiesterase class I)
LDLEVVAEGVETDTQYEYLLNNGCRLFQGYLFGRPESLYEFEQRLAPYRNKSSGHGSSEPRLG